MGGEPELKQQCFSQDVLQKIVDKLAELLLVYLATTQERGTDRTAV
jgi:hypothetical protein